MPGLVPVPESGTLVGFELALLVIDNVPLRAPIWLGVKSTWITQVPLAATGAEQLDQSTLVKSPLPAAAVMDRSVVPVFVIVTSFVVVDPS